jgi:hypothetical protein
MNDFSPHLLLHQNCRHVTKSGDLMLLHHDDDYMQDRQTDRNRDTRERERDTKMETERQRHNDDAQLLLRLWLERWSTKASGTV